MGGASTLPNNLLSTPASLTVLLSRNQAVKILYIYLYFTNNEIIITEIINYGNKGD